MPKTLKVSFAMGGGVSLGSFSGASLTEILKLLLLFGQDEEGNPYDQIVLDSFSGASAGAISLGIMMRCLMDYKTVMGLLKKKEADLIQQLKADYGEATIEAAFQEGKKEALLAAETCQQLQDTLWVENISIEQLFGVDKDPNKKSLSSLLERDYLNNSTVEYLLTGIDELANKTDAEIREGMQLLDKDRVLFACSLTNFSSISRIKTYDQDPILQSFERSYNDYDHKELRVVDFQFAPNLQSEARWLSMGLHGDPDFDLRDEQAWSMFASSTIACGAFPIAFSPVVLERYKKELFLPDGAQNLEGDTIKFAYIDGGTFNNEPISEAFKLAHYLDFNDPRPSSEYDRIVFFVDPIVSQADPAYKQAILQRFNAGYGDIKHAYRLEELKPRGLSGNLMGYASQLIGVLRREGVVKEGVKIQKFLETYKYRDQLVLSYKSTQFELQGEDLQGLLLTLINYTKEEIGGKRIPPGTADAIEFLCQKYNRILREEFGVELSGQELAEFEGLLKEVESVELMVTATEEAPAPEDIGKESAAPKTRGLFQEKGLKDLTQQASQMLYSYVQKEMGQNKELKSEWNKIGEQVKSFFKEPKAKVKSRSIGLESLDPGATISESQSRQQALSFLLLDLLMDCFDKDIKAYLVAVTPIDFYRTDKSREQLKTIQLPGHEIEAFSGFASKPSRRIAALQGRICSLGVLESGSFRKQRSDILVRLNGNNNSNGGSTIHPIISPELVATVKQQFQQQIQQLFSKNPNYLKTYYEQLDKSLKKTGMERIYEILLDSTQVGFLRKLLLTILSPIAAPLLGLTSLFKLLPTLLKKFVNSSFIDQGFVRMIQYHPGSELALQLVHDQFTSAKGSCRLLHEADGKRIELSSFKLGVDTAGTSVAILLPYIVQDDQPHFYYSKYRQRETEDILFDPEKVINKLEITTGKSLFNRGKQLEVELPPLAKIKDSAAKLKYFISPLLQINCNVSTSAGQLDCSIRDAAVPLKEQIIGLRKRG